MRVLRIADVAIGVRPEDPTIGISFADTHRAFVGESSDPEIEVGAAWCEAAATPGRAPVFDAGGAWHLARANGSYVLDFFTPLHGREPYKTLTVNGDWSRGRLALRREFYDATRPVRPLDYPLDELLVVHYLSRRDGVILHACGVVDESGTGYLFVGHSGAGKTTTARLWKDLPGVTILSDDRIVLRRHAGRLLMHGTPWHGEGGLSAPARAEITGIFILSHGPANEVSAVRPADAVADLVARSFLPFHDSAGVACAVALLEQAVCENPCRRFSFTPGPAAVEAVREWARCGRG